MSAYLVYLKLGFGHITDLGAYDHMLFLITLCAVYSLREWRQLLVLVTAFTVGHSLTLALVALGVFRIPAVLIEFLIPITILLTALLNVGVRRPEAKKVFSRPLWFHYGLTLFFGLIHGMGFSNYFRSLVTSNTDLVETLFFFNLGVELGQLQIVAIYLLFYFLMNRLWSIKREKWNLFFSGAGAGVAVILILGQLS